MSKGKVPSAAAQTLPFKEYARRKASVGQRISAHDGQPGRESVGQRNKVRQAAIRRWRSARPSRSTSSSLALCASAARAAVPRDRWRACHGLTSAAVTSPPLALGQPAEHAGNGAQQRLTVLVPSVRSAGRGGDGGHRRHVRHHPGDGRDGRLERWRLEEVEVDCVHEKERNAPEDAEKGELIHAEAQLGRKLLTLLLCHR
mmetsp:Transcript_41769/g.87430  ORF Transcript_41769/g.87430 Transcript_41769/m.87430 type:complete len:201 (+) Transcript_41769:278-880(+)